MTELQKLGMSLAVAYNDDTSLLDEFTRFAEDIDEIYLPIPSDVAGTMRIWYGSAPDVYRQTLPGIAARMKDQGIAVDMVINTNYLPFHEHARVACYTAEAMDMGIRRFTICDLNLARAVREQCPEAEIIASMSAGIDTLARARHWLREVQPQRIVVPPSLNKRPDALANLAKMGIPLEVIVDEGCLPSCPFSTQHYMALGGWGTADTSEADAYTELCWPRKQAYPWEHYQSDLVPAHVKHLSGVVSHLKLVGRGRPTQFIQRELRRYTELTSNRHQIFGYIEPDEVWDHVTTCDRYCEECGLCEQAYRAANPKISMSDSCWVSLPAKE